MFLATHFCDHGHNFLEHYSCYVPETDERIGFLDIEASNLDADFGIILSYCIKAAGEDRIYEDVIAPEDIARANAGDEDKRVVRTLISDLNNFDKLVTYYGTKFDIPYIRTRATNMAVPFPVFGTLVHKDLYYVVKNKFKLSSNRLENACRVLLNKTQKTRIDARYWRAGTRGDKKSLDYILDHNRKDVLDLEALYNKVIGFSRIQNVSI